MHGHHYSSPFFTAEYTTESLCYGVDWTRMCIQNSHEHVSVENLEQEVYWFLAGQLAA